MYSKECPDCKKEIMYKNYKTFYSAKKRNSICRSCRTTRANKSPNRNIKKENNPAWKGIGKVPGKYIKKIPNLDDRKFAANLLEEQNFKCALTGLLISFDDNTASLDRIDSKQPYITSNMQWVHKDVNIMKNGYNLDYFIKMCRLVVEQTKNVEITENVRSEFRFGSR